MRRENGSRNAFSSGEPLVRTGDGQFSTARGCCLRWSLAEICCSAAPATPRLDLSSRSRLQKRGRDSTSNKTQHILHDEQLLRLL